MSFFSLVNVLFVSLAFPCIFFFHPFFFMFLLIMWFALFIKLVGYDIVSVTIKPGVGFWLFLLSEIVVFVTLLVSCLWFQGIDSVALSCPYSLPLIETVLLVSSSIFISVYHFYASSARGYFYLVMSLIMAFIFLMIASYEVIYSEVSSLYNPHAASCYLVLGLHFSHVLMGSLLLVQLMYFSISNFVRCNSDVYIIYWHFVDYVWLFVYTVVYILV